MHYLDKKSRRKLKHNTNVPGVILVEKEVLDTIDDELWGNSNWYISTEHTTAFGSLYVVVCDMENPVSPNLRLRDLAKQRGMDECSRALTTLEDSGIVTVGQLMRIPVNRWWVIKGVGPKAKDVLMHLMAGVRTE